MTTQRKQFEQWYATHAFNYERDPIGSRDCGLQWAAWQAAQEHAIPIGWLLVPIDPTDAMLDAAHEGDREYTLRNFGDIMTVMQGPYDHWMPLPPAPTGETP